MPGSKRGVDRPTSRVVALIVLLMVAAAALRGYLPAHDYAARVQPGPGRAALAFVVVALGATLTVLVIAIIARLRDPRAMPPPGPGDLSGMLGGRAGRPSWRVLLVGLAVIVAWLLIAMLLARLWFPHAVAPSAPAPDQGVPPVNGTALAPKQHPQDDSANMLGILLASTIPMLLLIVVGTVIMSRRRHAAPTGALPDYNDGDDDEFPSAARRSVSLVRAAERGLAEIADLNREPREAIIACYAAMERELANVPGAVPQDFDTATEVLARAVEHQALRADSAVQLVNLFVEARFSPHQMNERHRELAVGALQVVLDELGSRSAA